MVDPVPPAAPPSPQAGDEVPPGVFHAVGSGSAPSRQSVKTKLMLMLHAQNPELDYLMLDTVVEHYLNNPDDGPEEVINKGKSALGEYFLPPDSKGPTVKFAHETYPTPEHALEEPSLSEETDEEGYVGDSERSDCACVSRGTQTSREGSERSGEQQPESGGEL